MVYFKSQCSCVPKVEWVVGRIKEGSIFFFPPPPFTVDDICVNGDVEFQKANKRVLPWREENRKKKKVDVFK